MKSETSTEIERKWHTASNFPSLGPHLSGLLPEPDQWALYMAARDEQQLISLTGRSVFVVRVEQADDHVKLAVGRAVVTDDGATEISLEDTRDNYVGGWQRAWHIDFERKPREFPTLEFTGRFGREQVNELEQLGRAIAEKAGWTVE